MEQLTARQQRAIESLMRARTLDDAAKGANVHRTTLWRWMNDATFRNALQRSTSDALSQTVRRLQSLSVCAVDALDDTMTAGNKPATRQRSAELVLVHGARLREMTELEARLSALEAMQPARDKRR